VRATEACFASFSVAIEAFRQHLELDETELLANLEAMSAAFDRAAAALSDRAAGAAG
jgi:hypothetical protein